MPCGTELINRDRVIVFKIEALINDRTSLSSLKRVVTKGIKHLEVTLVAIWLNWTDSISISSRDFGQNRERNQSVPEVADSLSPPVSCGTDISAADSSPIDLPWNDVRFSSTKQPMLQMFPHLARCQSFSPPDQSDADSHMEEDLCAAENHQNHQSHQNQQQDAEGKADNHMGEDCLCF